MTVLKPAVESMFSVCCVLAQPNAMARSAMAPIRFNPVNIFFMAYPFSRSLSGLISYLMVRWLLICQPSASIWAKIAAHMKGFTSESTVIIAW
jgi:hypothetical protein